MKDFMFFDNKSDINKKLYDKIVYVKNGINKKEDILFFYSVEFNFPSYFGKNWDALYDCLTDLHWLKNRNVLIVHQDIPFEKLNGDKKMYLNLLLDVVRKLKDDELIKVNVAFPGKFRDEIEWMLNNRNSLP